MHHLRPYQSEALTRVWEAYKAGKRRVIVFVAGRDGQDRRVRALSAGAPDEEMISVVLGFSEFGARSTDHPTVHSNLK